MLDKNFIEKIENMSETKTLIFDEREYTTKGIYEVKEPRPEALICRNLSSIVDYLEQNRDELKKEELLIHIVSHEEVILVSKFNSKWKQRENYITADIKGYTGKFAFGSKLDQESFIIGLQTNFIKTPNLETVQTIAGNFTSELLTTASDDGITQTVSQKVGITRLAKTEVPNPVELQPYRTFIEIENQPTSKFVFRLFKGREGELPTCALYEADGGLWKQTAVDEIKKYFAKKVKDIAVIA